MIPDEVQVLVVGAGPVGMLTALCLAENGISPLIIDKAERVAARSYACGLHPRTLSILDDFGLVQEVVSLGHRIETIAFYEGETRRAEFRLADIPGEFPYVVALDQSRLEALLEKELNQRGVKVRWSHRLTELEVQEGAIVAMIDQMELSAKGYIIPDWDWEVRQTWKTKASFVVGCDGYDSLVRHSLGIDYERIGSPEGFSIFEFESDGNYDESEVRVILDHAGTSAFWPLPGRRCHWFLPSSAEEMFEEAHDKERLWVELVDDKEEDLKNLRERIHQHAPWFKGGVKEIGWSSDIEFDPMLVNSFGRGRCWLAGDAAHQTGPVGMQSMNVGMAEAEELSDHLTRVIRNHATLDFLETYNQHRQSEWRQLLEAKAAFEMPVHASPWLREHGAKMICCLPASGSDLIHLLRQAGVEPHAATR